MLPQARLLKTEPLILPGNTRRLVTGQSKRWTVITMRNAHIPRNWQPCWKLRPMIGIKIFNKGLTVPDDDLYGPAALP